MATVGKLYRSCAILNPGKNLDNLYLESGHDEVYLPSSVVPEQLTIDELKQLDFYGAFFSDTYDCWCMFT